MTTPHDNRPPGPAPGSAGDAGPAAEPGPGPYDGPRVSREEIKDLGRLRRSSADKKVAGVAAGIARHLDIDPLVVRIGFVILVLFGGGGLLLYGACWLFVPDETSGEAVVTIDARSRTVVLAIAGLIAVTSTVGDSLGGWGFPWPLMIIAGGAVVFFLARNASPRPHPGPLPWVPPTDTAAAATGEQPRGDGPPDPSYAGYRPPPRMPSHPVHTMYPVNPLKRGPILFWFTMALAAVGVGVVLMLDLAGVDVPTATYPATVLAACGLMLVVGAVYGRAGGLILIGLLASVATIATALVPDIDGAVERTPMTAAQLAEDYRLGVGELKIDLTQLSASELARLDDETLDLDLSVGRIELIVPADGLSVAADASVDAGELRVFGKESTDTITLRHDGGKDAPELTVDADLRLGEIEIHTARSDR